MKPEEEKEYHKKNLLCFEKIMKIQNPDLTIHNYFMHLDGTCEKLDVSRSDWEVMHTDEATTS